MRSIVMSMALVALALPASAQHAGHGAPAGGGLPAGWEGRVDRENQKLEDVRFMTMGSSLHIVTGPHAILWQPERRATGSYRASATFRQAKAPERREGFGLFVGGRNLKAAGQDYLYFLARHDGSYMIRHRAGSEVHTLAEWTEHAAVKRAGENTPATNVLAIESLSNEVRFLINGQVVQTLQRVPMLNTDGVVGLRVGHHLDITVPEISVTPIGK